MSPQVPTLHPLLPLPTDLLLYTLKATPLQLRAALRAHENVTARVGSAGAEGLGVSLEERCVPLKSDREDRPASWALDDEVPAAVGGAVGQNQKARWEAVGW